MILINGINYLTPSEVTQKLNITRALVKYLRQNQKIEYLPHKNMYIYHPSILSTYKKARIESSLTFDGINRRLKCRKIEMVGSFRGVHKKAIFRCLIDNYEWEANVSALLYNNGKCKRCSYKHTKETINKLLKNRKIEILEDYDGPNIKKKWLCKKCNKIWENTPHRILHGNKQCPHCLRLNENKINQRLKDNEADIQLIGKYNGYSLKHDFLCLNCGNIWQSRVSNILKNRGCPSCTAYKNERYTKKYLEKMFSYISITHHYYIKINNKKLIIDFRFFINNKEYYVEYNGIQHYEPVTFGKTTSDSAIFRFQKQQTRDENLREYCKKNNINLIEIDGRKYKYKKIKYYLLDIFSK